MASKVKLCHDDMKHYQSYLVIEQEIPQTKPKRTITKYHAQELLPQDGIVDLNNAVSVYHVRCLGVSFAGILYSFRCCCLYV